MAHGGARPGAGKPKGSTNKALREAREKAAAGGLLPLDYLLQVMRNADVEEARHIDAAKAAAPYIHPRLATTVIEGNSDKPLHNVVNIYTNLPGAINDL